MAHPEPTTVVGNLERHLPVDQARKIPKGEQTMKHNSLNGGHKLTEVNPLNFVFAVAALIVFVSLGGCATMREETNRVQSETFERSRSLFAQGNYDSAFAENQKVFAEGRSPDIALFNMGMISAYSSNPKKDYPRALGYFRKVVKDYPESPLAEQAKVWIQVLEESQKIVDERRKLVEEKRNLTREREQLSHEREKLKYAMEKSRQLDIEIEKKRRETLSK
jgi:tetratricopeptide (TPR) repeat protein